VHGSTRDDGHWPTRHRRCAAACGRVRSRTDRNPQYIPDPRGAEGVRACVGRPRGTTAAGQLRLRILGCQRTANVRTSTPIHAECERSLVHDSVFSRKLHARIWHRVSWAFRWKIHSGTVRPLDTVRSPNFQYMYPS